MQYIIFFITFLLYYNTAFAGAWVLDKKERLLIQNFYYYKTNTFFDVNGIEIKQDNFTKGTVNTYLEEGITNDITLGTNIYFEFARQSEYSNQGIGDTEFFLRKLLYKSNKSVLSIQPLVKMPSYSADTLPKIGTDGWDGEIKLLYGRNFGKNHYLDTAIGYRKRFEGSSDQIRWELKAGLKINDKLTFIPVLYGTHNVGGLSEQQIIIANENDYNLVKAEVTFLYDINDKWAVQMGASQGVFSRNTAKGYEMLFSLWKRF